MAKFFFTYGTDPRFPYQGGWTEIEAEDSHAAVSAFRKFHPDRENSDAYNFAGIYSEKSWAKTEMSQKNSCFDHSCRESIRVTVDRETFYGTGKVMTIVEHVSYSRTIFDGT